MFCGNSNRLVSVESQQLDFNLTVPLDKDGLPGDITKLESSNLMGLHFILSKLDETNKEWRMKLTCNWIRINIDANFAAVTITIYGNTFGPWEPFRIQKCFKASLCKSGDATQSRLFKFKIEDAFCSNAELEGLLASFYKNLTKEIGRVSIRIEPLRYAKRVGLCMIERKAKAVAENAFYRNLKTDCCIKTGDLNFHCHKERLIAQSEAIGRLAALESKEINTPGMFVLDWSDYMDQKGVQAFLEFIYFSKLCSHNDPDVAFQMLQVADLYQMDHLDEACELILTTCESSSFEPDTMLDLFTYLKKLGKHDNILYYICPLVTSEFNKYEDALRKRSKQYPDIMLDIWHVAFNPPKINTVEGDVDFTFEFRSVHRQSLENEEDD